MKFNLITAAVFFLSCQKSSAYYVNRLDQRLEFQCPPEQHIYHLESVHNNDKEDRRWGFRCRSGFVSNDCSWTGYVNAYDKLLNVHCPNNGLLVGLQSVHDNDYEDRRWRLKCCKINTKAPLSCRWTGWINDWDKAMNYRLGNGEAIRALYSLHSNDKEDRRWQLRVCKYVKCQAKKMRIVSDVVATSSGTKVVGISTSQGCAPGVSYEISLSNTESVTETYSFTTGKGKSFTFNTELSVQAEASAKFLGTGGSITVGVSQSFGGSLDWSTSKTKESSSESSSSSQQALTYTGPGAALIMADVQYYKFDTSNVDVEYDIECDDGSKHKERATVSLKAETFSQTHFYQLVGKYNPGQCSFTANQCIRNLNGRNALQTSQITEEFKNCFERKGTVHKK